MSAIPALGAAASAPANVDETGEATNDPAALYADQLSRRVGLSMIAAQNATQEAQLKLDRIKSAFNQSQEERSEILREMNALRDMAIEQAKKDDDVLKKYIAMI